MVVLSRISSYFFMLNNIPLHLYPFSLSIHLLIDTKVVPLSWLWEITQ